MRITNQLRAFVTASQRAPLASLPEDGALRSRIEHELGQIDATLVLKRVSQGKASTWLGVATPERTEHTLRPQLGISVTAGAASAATGMAPIERLHLWARKLTADSHKPGATTESGHIWVILRSPTGKPLLVCNVNTVRTGPFPLSDPAAASL